MLIISRRLGESFYIGDTIKVTILPHIDNRCSNQVRVGIDAPRDINIIRE
ncbi:MAG: carbon storage regulator [Candidatus Thiodiazotropha sp.]|jgi:carbon storage regulator CsrA